MIERPLFPMDFLRVTQGPNGSFSHKGTFNLDSGGRDTGKDNLKSPFTGVIKAITTGMNGVYLESLNPVYYADGTIDYMTIYLLHDNDISDLKIGQVIPQGKIFYQEGTKGNVAIHNHMSVARGKYAGGFYNSYKHWCVKNAISPEKGLWLYNTTVLDNGGLNFKTTDTPTYELPKPKPSTINYIVQRGDSLSKIGGKFGVQWQNIAKLNNIKAPKYIIYAGQNLRIK